MEESIQSSVKSCFRCEAKIEGLWLTAMFLHQGPHPRGSQEPDVTMVSTIRQHSRRNLRCKRTVKATRRGNRESTAVRPSYQSRWVKCSSHPTPEGGFRFVAASSCRAELKSDLKTEVLIIQGHPMPRPGSASKKKHLTFTMSPSTFD